jgi:serpin B
MKWLVGIICIWERFTLPERKDNMKTIPAILVFLSILFSSCVACAESPSEPKGETNSAGKSINAFAVDLYAKFKDSKGNMFFSPYSISTALSMAYAGAEGETARQMEKVLHFGRSGESIHPAFASLIGQINDPSHKESYKLWVANAMWGQKGYSFRNEYLKLLEEQYDSELNQVDFKKNPEGVRTTINKWAEKKTNDKIKDLIQAGAIGPLTRLILTNAIYFKAAWAEQFSKGTTKEGPFYFGDGRQIKTPMMRQTENLKYFEDNKVQVLNLPYQNYDLSMTIILPRKIDGLGDVEKIFISGTLDKWEEDLKHQTVDVSLPKFKVTSSFGLGDVLKSMGMKDAFSLPPADFSKMTVSSFL